MVNCKICNSLLKNEKSLSFHMWQKHKIEWNDIKNSKIKNKTISCSICNKKFKNLMGLQQHNGHFHKEILLKQKIEKEENKKFICEECGHKISTIQGLKTHIGMYHKKPRKNKKFKCKLCEKQSDTLFGFSMHISNHHLSQKEYYIQVLEKEIEYCKCGKEKKFKNIVEGYKTTCGDRKCKYHIQEIVQKSKITSMKKFGVDHYSKTEESRNIMIKNKNIILKKRKTTNKNKFGNEIPMRVNEVKLKRQESMINRGYKKQRETCLNLYGEDHYSKTNEFKKRYKQTFLAKYGFDHPMKVLDIKIKAVINSHKSNNSKAYSNESVKIFEKLIKIFKLEKYNPFYKKNEKIYYDKNNKIYKYDFVIEIDNKPVLIIEYNGVIFHPKNKNIPNGNPYNIDIEKAEINDNQRKEFGNKISNNNLYIIWSDEWKRNESIIMEDLKQLFSKLPTIGIN